MRVFNEQEWFEAVRRPRPWHSQYYAMYSSVLGGIVTNPALMVVPADDHLVHRGDGVFETLKAVEGALYNVDAHVERLYQSAQGIRLNPPWPPQALKDLIVATVRAGQRRDALVRVLVSRGPGGFGVNPRECPEPALYIVAYEYPGSFMDLHPEGARACRSRIPAREARWAGIKWANYLPNVLMKMEAVEAGVDFSLGFDENGFLTEGATENATVVTSDGKLLVPRKERILVGTTLQRVLELAHAHWHEAPLTSIEEADIPYETVRKARELLVLGTTPDVTAVVEFDGSPIGEGKPGPVALWLGRLLRRDILTNPLLRTPVF